MTLRRASRKTFTKPASSATPSRRPWHRASRNEAQTRDRGTNGPALTTPVDGLREGVLLEAGFAKVTPNEPKDISSWAYDYAADKVEIIDNRAKAVACYDPGYTLVEKLQTMQ